MSSFVGLGKQDRLFDHLTKPLQNLDFKWERRKTLEVMKKKTVT